MYMTDESERSLGAFILVSLILHALVIFLYPQWQIAAGPGMLLAGNGGIITLMPVEPDRPSPQARVTRQPSQGSVGDTKKTTETKDPTPKPETEVKAEIKPEAPKEQAPVEEKSPVTPAQETTAKPETEAGKAPELVEDEDRNILEPGQDDDTLLTSDQGQEVAVAGGGSRERPMGGTEVDSTDKQAVVPAEPVPPPPPPLPAAGSVVMGGGKVQYPKNAINEGLAGEVKLEVYVPKGSTKASHIVIKESSGTQNLDQVARLTVQNGWTMEPLLEDYVLSVTVVFSGPPRFEVGILYDGIRYAKGVETSN